MKPSILFGVCTSLILFFAVSSAPAAELTPELMSDLKMVEDAQLSPDGQWVTYLLSDETAREGMGRSVELWIASGRLRSSRSASAPMARASRR